MKQIQKSIFYYKAGPALRLAPPTNLAQQIVRDASNNDPHFLDIRTKPTESQLTVWEYLEEIQ
jgi:O6-methylguanine-DNA--protein-cysteine methyltransferase